MAAPPTTARILPLAIRLDCGYQSIIAFQHEPNLAIFEKTVQPPEFDGGDAIKTTTMLNEAYESKAPQRLVGHGDSVVVAAYDPHVLSTLQGIINQPQGVTWAYPDGSAESYWAYLQKAAKSPLAKDQQPEMTLTIVITNWDPINCIEHGPTFVQGTGSCGPYTPPI